MKKKASILKITLITLLILLLLSMISAYPLFLLSKKMVNDYFGEWGDKLVNLEKRGLLSKEFGAGWQDVLTDEAMALEVARITKNDSLTSNDNEIKVVDGIVLADYPSLSIIEKLRAVRTYSSSIEIVDRNDKFIANIRTDHQRAKISEFPQTLITALLAAEDGSFKENTIGFDYESFVRAFVRAAVQSAISFKKVTPKGTSTITQQVAKLFISKLDEQGMRYVNRNVDRKVRELRLAVALRKMYTPDDILEVYLNHCVTSDNGMIGYKDIAKGLFGKNLNQLTDAQCIYLSRMVKWGRNVPSKIIRQCKIDMPRMGKALGWDTQKQASIISDIEKLTFSKPRRFQGNNGPLVDLANEYWLKTLKNNGSSHDQLTSMDLINPNSLIRKKGNLKIKLHIDLQLQKILEQLVNSRGYGPDTTILDEIRVGKDEEIITRSSKPKDTLHAHKVLLDPIDFNEPGSAFITSLNPGDSAIVNIQYKKTGINQYRKTTTYFVRRPVVVNGQYFAYSIIDSKTGLLLAYYSKDRLGSKLACLLKNRTPNGSSLAKPIMNALNFDMGNFKPYERWTDVVPVTDDVPWKRSIHSDRGKPVGVSFVNSAVKGQKYIVHNHGHIFEGCQYIFDLLSTSNNILGVETMYRMNRKLFNYQGEIEPESFALVQFLSRIGAFSKIKDSLALSSITGVRVYKELAKIVGVNTDSVMAYGKLTPLSDSLYSIALGTLEMSLYEQMHLFNSLYNNDIIENPSAHPSLVIDCILLNGDTVQLNDTIRRFHPFADMNNIRPSLLGMHKRLVSNRGDNLIDYDIAYSADPSNSSNSSTEFSPDVFTISEPLSNFAKSGTTDDVIKPFNVSSSSKKRTNYGLWNAVIRVDFARFKGFGDPQISDITVSCIGECNTQYTGMRDGKTLHKFVTQGLLRMAGIKAPNGFYSQYEKYLKNISSQNGNCDNQFSNGIDNASLDNRGD
jgi:hypothetical protein